MVKGANAAAHGLIKTSRAAKWPLNVVAELIHSCEPEREHWPPGQ